MNASILPSAPALAAVSNEPGGDAGGAPLAFLANLDGARGGRSALSMLDGAPLPVPPASRTLPAPAAVSAEPSDSVPLAGEQRYLEVARRMELLHLGDSAGVVYWQPAGLRLYEKLRSYIRRVHQDHGYLEVKTPALVGLAVFERSGHLGKYRENMFLVNQANDLAKSPTLDQYALRPMSCPNHIELYQSARRSYRELPLALFEFGEVFRNEPSGSLQVLFRQRQFCQDDAHVFVAPDQVLAGVRNFLEMALKVYGDLGFDKVEVAISLRPEHRFGEDVLWDHAEDGLRQACRDAGLNWVEQPGGGAFYGPKVELGVRDKLGRLWQMGTIQLDYVLPERFGLEFVSDESKHVRPVLLHHAVLGSLERMIGTLLESHGTALPAVVHPYPLVLVPVSQAHLDWALAVAKEVRRLGGECLVEKANDSVPAKVRVWKVRGALDIKVIGDKELAMFGPPAEMAKSLCASYS